MQLPLSLVKIDGEEEFKILEILDSKIDLRWKCKLQYLVHWLEYEGTDKELSWIATDEVYALEAISGFHSFYPDKPGPSDSLWLFCTFQTFVCFSFQPALSIFCF